MRINSDIMLSMLEIEVTYYPTGQVEKQRNRVSKKIFTPVPGFPLLMRERNGVVELAYDPRKILIAYDGGSLVSPDATREGVSLIKLRDQALRIFPRSREHQGLINPFVIEYSKKIWQR